MVPRERQQLLCHRSCRRGAHLTGNSEVIHNREPSWETSLDSLRNQAITLTEKLQGLGRRCVLACRCTVGKKSKTPRTVRFAGLPIPASPCWRTRNLDTY